MRSLPVSGDSPKLHPDDTPDHLAWVVRTVHAKAARWARWSNIPMEEYQDVLCHKLLLAWESYNPVYGVPFYQHAFTAIRHGFYATAKHYRAVHFLGQHELPHAHCLRRDPAHHEPWFRGYLRSHERCMTPAMRRTLHDLLAGESVEDIARREGIGANEVYRRQTALIRFVRQHVYGHETPPAAPSPRATQFVPQRLLDAKADAGLSFRQIARYCRVSSACPQYWAHGKSVPSLAHVHQLSALLGHPVTYFLAEEPPRCLQDSNA